jgi:hypothetical protein
MEETMDVAFLLQRIPEIYVLRMKTYISMLKLLM